MPMMTRRTLFGMLAAAVAAPFVPRPEHSELGIAQRFIRCWTPDPPVTLREAFAFTMSPRPVEADLFIVSGGQAYRCARDEFAKIGDRIGDRISIRLPQRFHEGNHDA